ncbi:branched-chain amino acid ABC transporter permease [Limnochorda pilosa]|uniref:ABC transporter permease n=1 Tax=Limnochorda pilosa TaxID=1555112 RepID=A0A0K2SGH0_LIMPI|nr:branched-chain amino acid ABC transporter permease [Limnochorda pilosa]BAS26180.1 ABC transporter permease [Limnochorda pilosa]
MELRQSYREEIALVRGWAGWTATAGLAFALLTLPAWISGYSLYIVTHLMIQALAAVGLNLLIGYTGQISLGHAGFYAIGAYAAAHGLTTFGHPLPVALALAGLAAAAAGYLVGLPALRLTGPYLAIVTLGFGIAVHQALTNWAAVSGGRIGLFVPRPALGPWRLEGDTAVYFLVLVVGAALVLVAYNLTRSHVGRAWVAIRDSDLAAEAAGVSLRQYKSLAFAVSAFYGGVAGGLGAILLGYLEPQMFTFVESIYFLAMVVVGGLGRIPGGIIGGVLVAAIPQVMSGLQEWLPLIFGAIIMAAIAFEPTGLYGRWLRIRRYFKSWPL